MSQSQEFNEKASKEVLDTRQSSTISLKDTKKEYESDPTSDSTDNDGESSNRSQMTLVDDNGNPKPSDEVESNHVRESQETEGTRGYSTGSAPTDVDTITPTDTVESEENTPDGPDLPPPYRWSRRISRNITDTGYRPPLGYRHEKLSQKSPGLMEHPSITFGGPMIVLFDIVVPCIIYYTWYNTKNKDWKRNCAAQYPHSNPCPLAKPEYDENILGYAIISFGIGEMWILIARVYRLFFFQKECAPLLSRAPWELDATSWVYFVALICALIPFVVGSSMVIPKLYLYSPAFIMAFLGILMVFTLFPIPIPVGINSHARGGGIRPFIYYAAEDFIAVDGLQDREFRIRYNARYENSPHFRRMFVMLTIWWIIGVCVYITCLSAVVWCVEFHYAFGLSLGILFAYIATWAGTSYAFVMWENKYEYERAKESGVLAENYDET